MARDKSGKTAKPASKHKNEKKVGKKSKSSRSSTTKKPKTGQHGNINRGEEPKRKFSKAFITAIIILIIGIVFLFFALALYFHLGGFALAASPSDNTGSLDWGTLISNNILWIAIVVVVIIIIIIAAIFTGGGDKNQGAAKSGAAGASQQSSAGRSFNFNIYANDESTPIPRETQQKSTATVTANAPKSSATPATSPAGASPQSTPPKKGLF
jgi:flagellar basal body-associated protein FliL